MNCLNCGSQCIFIQSKVCTYVYFAYYYWIRSGRRHDRDKMKATGYEIQPQMKVGDIHPSPPPFHVSPRQKYKNYILHNSTPGWHWGFKSCAAAAPTKMTIPHNKNSVVNYASRQTHFVVDYVWLLTSHKSFSNESARVAPNTIVFARFSFFCVVLIKQISDIILNLIK